MAQHGVKWIINLGDDSSASKRESEAALRLRMHAFLSPMNVIQVPNTAAVDQVLWLLATSNADPIFIHCFYGQDRTGLLVGLYRVLGMNWKPADAYNEMLTYGFHRAYSNLDQSFRYRTGFHSGARVAALRRGPGIPFLLQLIR